MRRSLLNGIACLLLGLVLTAPPHAQGRESGGSAYRVLQMNLCLSGLARCFPRTHHRSVVDEAATRIEETDADAVTLNEACSGDVAALARRTGYDSRFAIVTYRGAPLPCRNPDGRGFFGDAVLTKVHIRSSQDAAYVGQDGVEERRWICVTSARDITVCGTHLATRGTASAAGVNDAQCLELGRVLADLARNGPTVAAGDMNRLPSCAPADMTSYDDANAGQAPGIQHAYLSSSFVDGRESTIPMTYTDHDALLIGVGRLVPGPW